MSNLKSSHVYKWILSSRSLTVIRGFAYVITGGWSDVIPAPAVLVSLFEKRIRLEA